MTLKLVLRDERGDDWLFKMGDTAVDGAEAVYRIGCLFGWETPELHRATLPINGLMVSGSVQRFIHDADELTDHVYGPKAERRRFSESALEYLLTAQLLGWITANHHVHTRQFIFPRESDPIDRIHRIDNTVEWFLVDRDTLAAGYVTPFLAHRKSRSMLGYDWMWRRFRESVIELPLAEAYALARFVADFPDEIFAESFLPGIENDFRFLPNVNELTLGLVSRKIGIEGNKERFLERLVARKHRLPESTEALFDEQLAERGAERDYRDGPSPRTIGEQLCAHLEARIAELEQRSEALPREPSPQEPIHAITSFAAHSVLLHAFVPGNVSGDRAIQIHRFRNAIEELRALAAQTEDPNERAAIDIAIDATRAELATSRGPDEYVRFVAHLNELFPVSPVVSGSVD